jgi:hypothetical protein
MDEPMPLGDLPEDEYTQLLAQTLRREGDRVRPSDRFADLWAIAEESRIEDDRPRAGTFRWLAAVAVAAVATGVALPLLAPGLLPDPAASTTPPAASSPSANSQAPTGPPSIPTINRGVAVYYVDSHGSLAREFRDLPTQTDRLTTAVAAVLNVAPLDPNYGSRWSGGQVNSAQVAGNRITLDLSKTAFGSMQTRAQMLQGINQVTYTATAAVGDRNGQKVVRILVDGSPNLPLIGAPSTDFTRSGVDPLTDVIVDSFEYGDTISSPVTITGQVKTSALAGTDGLSWSIVAKGASASGWQPVSFGKPAGGYTPFTIDGPDLAAGSYALHLEYTSPKDGQLQVVKLFLVH